MLERKIELLNDDDIGYILSGLHLLIQKCVSDNDKNTIDIIDKLYNKIDLSYEMGVISNEKIEY